MMKPYVDNYPYELSNPFSPNRDTLTAIIAIDGVLRKLNDIPKDLTFVVDGHPIYLLAQQFFAQHGIYFDIKQVTGLINNDSVFSTEFRPLKQIIERLHRTLKGN